MRTCALHVCSFHMRPLPPCTATPTFIENIGQAMALQLDYFSTPEWYFYAQMAPYLEVSNVQHQSHRLWVPVHVCAGFELPNILK